jgi:hypothetical protein
MLNISIDGVFLTEAIVLPPLVTLLTSRETD